MSIENRKLGHNYQIIETFEAGVVLSGAEVKSVRSNRASISDSFARLKNGEMFLINAYIAPYMGSKDDATRQRKLLLNRRQLDHIAGEVQKGLTLVPKKLYNKGPWIKLEVAVAKGKKQYQKREDLRRRAIDRDIAGEVRGDKKKFQDETRR